MRKRRFKQIMHLQNYDLLGFNFSDKMEAMLFLAVTYAVIQILSAASVPYLCVQGEFYNRDLMDCVKCSDCPANQVSVPAGNTRKPSAAPSGNSSFTNLRLSSSQSSLATTFSPRLMSHINTRTRRQWRLQKTFPVTNVHDHDGVGGDPRFHVYPGCDSTLHHALGLQETQTRDRLRSW